MDLNSADIEEFQEAGESRKRYKANLSLKAGKAFNFGKVKKCRKIYTHVTHGTIRFEIRGDYHSDMSCQAGFKGGPLSGGGGDFSPGTLTIRVLAPVDANFYIHIEWLEGNPITING